MDLAAWFLVDQKVSRSENHIDHLRDGIDVHRTEMLNHRVQAAGTLRCGDLIEGILLAESFAANPTGFADNSLVPICLSIVNQFGDVHKSTTRARLKRIAERIQLRPVRQTSLFERQMAHPAVRSGARHSRCSRTPQQPARSAGTIGPIRQYVVKRYNVASAISLSPAI